MDGVEDPADREELRVLLTKEDDTPMVSPDDDDWTPPGWGTDEENAKEAEAFAHWTRSLGAARS